MSDYYSPDYFRTANEQYDKKTDRIAWLELQISLADKSLFENQSILADYYNQLAKRGVSIDNVQGISVQPGKGYAIAGAVGGVVATIPVGWTQIVGGVIILGSSLISKLETKAKEGWAKNLLIVARRKLTESEQIAAYRQKYIQELKFRQFVPWIMAIVFLLLLK